MIVIAWAGPTRTRALLSRWPLAVLMSRPSAYMLAFGAVVPLWANIGNVVGRTPVILVTTGIFFAGTLVGALSQSAGVLVTGRAMQGIGCGGLTVLVNICVGDLFSVRERGLYYGVIGAILAVSSAAGPLVGGVLMEKLGWRWCFWINVPFIAVSFLVLALVLNIKSPKISLAQGVMAIDWLGISAIVIATLLLLIGLQFCGTVAPWNSTLVISLILFGTLTFGIFAVLEWKVAKMPLMPVRFFATRSRVAILTVCASQSFITTGCTYFLPLYFQLVLGISPLVSGIYFLPTTLTLAFFFICVGHIVKRSGKYLRLIQCGASALLLGTGLLIDSRAYPSWPRLITSQILVAIGLGLTYQAPLIAFHAQLEQQDIAMGTSTFQFIKTFCQTISVIVGQLVLQNRIQKRSYVLSVAGLPKELISTLSGGNAISSATAIRALQPTQQGTVRIILTAAMDDMWVLYTVVAATGVVASFGIAGIILSP